MYKDPLLSNKENEIGKTVIKHKIAQVASKIVDPNQSDADFVQNLHDLCVLNQMAESHLPTKAAIEKERTDK